MMLLLDAPTQGHIHEPSTIGWKRSICRCRHCNKYITVNESDSAWVPVQFEPSDFFRRDEGDYIVADPDMPRSWLACVWNMAGKGRRPQWRHDRMGITSDSFPTMKAAIEDRCSL